MIVFKGDKHWDTRIDEPPKNTPVKVLDVVLRPAVMCPFSKTYRTLDQCKECNNYVGLKKSRISFKCKWPY